jgi:hypothetical protein
MKYRVHTLCNFYVEFTNIIKIEGTWLWPYTAETRSEEEGWLENVTFKMEIFTYIKKNDRLYHFMF